jgi:FtsZ-binding cell division protein ZapB
MCMTAATTALQQEVEHLQFANKGLEAELARLAAAATGSATGSAASGGGGAELDLLRHELEDLRHDNEEMENGFHEAAAQVPMLEGHCEH